LKHISIKLAQFNLQKCIPWPKEYGKGNTNGIKPSFILDLVQEC
jgi:hypothetical protein